QRVWAAQARARAIGAVSVELHLVAGIHRGPPGDRDRVPHRGSRDRGVERGLPLAETGAVVGDIASDAVDRRAARIAPVDEARAAELAAERELVTIVVD